MDKTINSVKKYSDFKLVLKAKGYENFKDGGKYLTMKTPYFSRNIRIDRAFGDKYSVQELIKIDKKKSQKLLINNN